MRGFKGVPKSGLVSARRAAADYPIDALERPNGSKVPPALSPCAAGKPGRAKHTVSLPSNAASRAPKLIYVSLAGPIWMRSRW